MRIAIVTFPGSNCDYDVYKAVKDVLGGQAEFVWHRQARLGAVDAVVLPGGFSYGDYLRAGAIARFSPIMTEVLRFADAGGPVLGICNGFQVLCESGLLPGALVRNRSLTFRSMAVHLRVESAETLYTRRYAEGEILSIPIAHAEGAYVADAETLDRLEGERRIVFRYVDVDGRSTDEANPNGSANNIAGIVNDGGNVLGLMPHPERAVEALLGSMDGLRLFESLRDHIEAGGPAPFRSGEAPPGVTLKEAAGHDGRAAAGSPSSAVAPPLGAPSGGAGYAEGGR